MVDEDARAPSEEREGDIFAVRARVSEDQVNELIRRGLDYGDRPHFSIDRDGTGRLDLFVTRRQVEALATEGIDVEIVNNQSARHRERKAELGEGDRFEGGKIAPTGIGRKIGGRGGDRQQRPPTPPSTPEGGPEPRS